jgi:anchored repeat ABC transporter substrate-binding protein
MNAELACAVVARAVLVLGGLCLFMGIACSPRSDFQDNEKIKVVVTTEIIADLVRQVGGDRVQVSTVVPPGGDPHSYEPTPGDARKVAEADVAFTNYLLLEEHALIKLFDNNVRSGAPNVSLAETAEQYGAHLIPLVEDVGLDVLWLGMAVRGKGSSRSEDIRLVATGLDGPGDFFAYVTSSLGVPEVYFNSTDGLDESDVAVLPPGAHTHLNWTFTNPGVYHLTLQAEVGDGASRQVLGTATYTFAVGVSPSSLGEGHHIVNEGHADLGVDLDGGQMFVCTAPLSCADQKGDVLPSDAVIEVPNKAIALVPDDPQFSFLGSPGSQVWELPQAVLGKHVHGEIDPHIWEDVKNAKAMVQVMADVLASVDSEGRDTYFANRDSYLAELTDLDQYVADRVKEIPEGNRDLVTTHDAFSYLAYAYGMRVAGFVVPNPAQEPSAVQVTRLTETIKNLDVPAVFVEPNLQARAKVLRQVAEDQGVQVCTLYGDAFDEHVHSYIEMMRHNADELLRCLGGRR